MFRQRMCVTSREVVRVFLRQFWFKFVPVIHGLQGRSALKNRLWEVLIIEQYITVHRRIKVFPRSEVMTLEDILYTPVDSLNHAVCLRRLCWGQTMVNAEFAAQRVEPLFASRCTLAQAKETVSERLTVANVARTIGAIIGNSVRMVRMIFYVDMQVTRLIGLEGAVLWLCLFDLQVAQITHPMTTQA
jgi:hypothetical protein